MIFLPNGSPVLTSVGASITPAVERAAADLYIVTVGDSMTRDRGYAAYGNQLKAMILAERGEVAYLEKRGVNGISWDYCWGGDPFPNTLIEHGPKVDALRQTTKPHWLLLWAGSNGIALGGHSAAEEAAGATAYIDARIAAGQDPDRLVLIPMLSRGSASDAVRDDYNGLLEALAISRGCRFAPIHDDPDIGVNGAYSDTDWFYEDPHLNDAGHGRVALITFNTMFPA